MKLGMYFNLGECLIEVFENNIPFYNFFDFYAKRVNITDDCSTLYTAMSVGNTFHKEEDNLLTQRFWVEEEDDVNKMYLIDFTEEEFNSNAEFCKETSELIACMCFFFNYSNVKQYY